MFTVPAAVKSFSAKICKINTLPWRGGMAA
jgi:hypothetical protein